VPFTEEDCNDNNECTNDYCDPNTGCYHSDKSACCDDDNECTTDSCDPILGCLNIPVDCDDSDSDTDDSCNIFTGCVNTPSYT